MKQNLIHLGPGIAFQREYRWRHACGLKFANSTAKLKLSLVHKTWPPECPNGIRSQFKKE
jgi:hypothetical protein